MLRAPIRIAALLLLAIAAAAPGCRESPIDPHAPVQLSIRGTIRYTNDWPGIRPGDPVPGAIVALVKRSDWNSPLASATANARGEYELKLRTTRVECQQLIILAALNTAGFGGYDTEQSRRFGCGLAVTQRIDLKFTVHGY